VLPERETPSLDSLLLAVSFSLYEVYELDRFAPCATPRSDHRVYLAPLAIEPRYLW
jgi:hypothetical protein